MKKGVAVPYIIAVLLGVAVIGLIGYWLFVSSGRFGTSAGQTQCVNDLTNFCNRALNGGGIAQTDWTQSDACKGVGKYASKPSSTDCGSIGVTVS